MEYARWDRIFSTVPFTSMVPVSSKRRIQISRVQNVPEMICNNNNNDNDDNNNNNNNNSNNNNNNNHLPIYIPG